MRKFVVVALLAQAACQDPPKTGQLELSVRSLVDLHAWDPAIEGKGQNSYDTVLGWGKEAWPQLVAHLTDETPTLLYDAAFDIRVKLGDVCLYMLLKEMNLDWKEFFKEGVRMPTMLPNPIFCIRWVEPELASRRRVQARFVELIKPPDD